VPCNGWQTPLPPFPERWEDPERLLRGPRWAGLLNTGKGEGAGDILETAAGYVVGGLTLAANIGGKGRSDAWIVKLDPEGRIVSQYAYGDDRSEHIRRLAPARDGGFVALVQSESTVRRHAPVLLKFGAASESPQWQKMYVASGRDWAEDIRPTSDGGYVIAGATDPCACGGRPRATVMKVDGGGELLWARSFVPPPWRVETTTATSIVEAADGGYVVAGELWEESSIASLLLIRLDRDGGLLWSTSYGWILEEAPGQIEAAGDDGFIIAGRANPSGGGDRALWLLKILADGTFDWTAVYLKNKAEVGTRIVVAPGGGYVVAGHVLAPRRPGPELYDRDLWILKLDSEGRLLRQRAFDARGFSDNVVGLRATRDGGFVLVGTQGDRCTLCDAAPSSRGILVVKTDANLEVSDDYGSDTEALRVPWTSTPTYHQMLQDDLVVTTLPIEMSIAPTAGRNHVWDAGHYGPPPEMRSVSTQLFADQIQCDVTETFVAQLCTLGFPGLVPTAPIVIESTYDMLVLSADVTDRDSTAGHNDIAEVRVEFAPLVNPANVSQVLLPDDGSSTFELVRQKAITWGGKDCRYDPVIGLCECRLAHYPTYSGDSSSGDGRYTLEMGLFGGATPREAIDCFLVARSRAPFERLPRDAPVEVRLSAVDRQGNVTTWPEPFELTIGGGSHTCSGDECGCCLVLNPDFIYQDCSGKPGLPLPGFPQGLCNLF
jgi:hypothetical protein